MAKMNVEKLKDGWCYFLFGWKREVYAGVNAIPAIEEVNIFKDDTVISFQNQSASFHCSKYMVVVLTDKMVLYDGLMNTTAECLLFFAGWVILLNTDTSGKFRSCKDHLNLSILGIALYDQNQNHREDDEKMECLLLKFAVIAVGLMSYMQSAVGIRFVIDREECFSHEVPYVEIQFMFHLLSSNLRLRGIMEMRSTSLLSLEQINTLEEALYNIQFEQHWLEAQTERQALGMSRRAVHKALFESAALIGASILQVYLLRRLFERKLGTSRV
ncbi:hypothetical protein HPP92_006740 [Vanilla planifolia]|uniref:Uncharacterized protein n=1 Tax=Vanilla planifolia TaxID=51239 RepID=A0A835V8Z1_VANPL|nr:hypothetical protein HPP92_006740 [Vanilla planifolia]